MDYSNFSLDDCKAAQLAALKSNFPGSLDFNLKYNDAVYQADTKSYEAMLFALAHSSLPNNFYWIDIDNNKININRTQLQEIASLIAEERFRRFDLYQQHKIKIREVETLDDFFEVTVPDIMDLFKPFPSAI